MIKTIVGMLVSKSLRWKGVPCPVENAVPWTKYIYQPETMPNNFGLYFSNDMNKRYHVFRGVDILPKIWSIDGSLIGADIFMCGLNFSIILANIPNNLYPIIQRPRTIKIYRHDKMHKPFEIEIYWNDTKFNETVHLRKEPLNKVVTEEEGYVVDEK
jgi:hypothetical protein